MSKEIEAAATKLKKTEVELLNEKIDELKKKIPNTFLLARKRREFTTPVLAASVKLLYAFEDACMLMNQCLTAEEDRIDFAKCMLEKLEGTLSNSGNV